MHFFRKNTLQYQEHLDQHQLPVNTQLGLDLQRILKGLHHQLPLSHQHQPKVTDNVIDTSLIKNVVTKSVTLEDT